MFVIGAMPRELQSFFGTTEDFFDVRQWQRFWMMALVFASAYGRRNVAHLNRSLENRDERQRYQDFLVESPWDGAAVLQAIALWMLDKLLKPRKGELLEVLIDLSHAAKRGATMEGAHRYFDPVTKSYRFGHAFVLCALRLRGVVIPWAIRLWLPRAFCRSTRGKELGLEFKTSNEIAAEMIRELPEQFTNLFKVRVLFDSGFLNAEVVGACRERGVHFLSVAKANRVFFPFSYARKCKVSSYGPGVLKTEGKVVRANGYRGRAEFLVAARSGSMRGLGVVQVVFSRRLSDNSFVALVTDELDLAPRDAIIAYKSRWPIEVTLKNLKQYLGLGDYQTARYEGLIHHLHLSLISLQLLTTLSLQGSAKKHISRGTAIEIESVPCLQDRLRTLLARDRIRRLQRSKNPRRALSRLGPLLVAS